MKDSAPKSAPAADGNTNGPRLSTTARSEVNTISACIPENKQGETETLWAGDEKLILNFRSVLIWILSSNYMPWLIPLSFCRAKPTNASQ